jgi:sigma-B regulation protein RsbU (phosphoserine phosphatase)
VDPPPDIFTLGRALAALDGRDILDEFDTVAQDIQRGLLDVRNVRYAGLDVGIRAAPARIVGGDYLDVVDRNGLPPVFAIGDASGRSLPAALRALTLKYVIRALIAADRELVDIVGTANVVMADAVHGEEFLSMVLCAIGDGGRTLAIANAGHDPPLVYRADRDDVDELPPSGLVLGIDRAHRYAEQRVPLGPRDIVVLYTDGFVEARNPRGEQFTLAHLKDCLLEGVTFEAQALADALFERVEEHAAGTMRDDASVMVVRVE